MRWLKTRKSQKIIDISKILHKYCTKSSTQWCWGSLSNKSVCPAVVLYQKNNSQNLYLSLTHQTRVPYCVESAVRVVDWYQRAERLWWSLRLIMPSMMRLLAVSSINYMTKKVRWLFSVLEAYLAFLILSYLTVGYLAQPCWVSLIFGLGQSAWQCCSLSSTSCVGSGTIFLFVALWDQACVRFRFFSSWSDICCNEIPFRALASDIVYKSV